MRNEIRAVSKLCDGRNINIIDVFRCGEIDGGPYRYIDMELCEMNLADYNHRFWTEMNVSSEHQSVPKFLGICDITKQIANALVFLHSNEEVHRDLKPQNGILQENDT